MLGKLLVKHIVIALVAVDRGTSFWCNSTELKRDAVLGLFPVINAVVVATATVIVTPSTAKVTTLHAQPKI